MEAPERRVPLNSHYGDGRFLVAIYNLGGVGVYPRSIHAEVSCEESTLNKALDRMARRGLVTVRVVSENLGKRRRCSLTESGRKEAIVASPDVAKWVERYAAGESLQAIAQRPYSVPVVRQALINAGVTIRGHGKSAARRARTGRRGHLRIVPNPEWAVRYTEKGEDIRSLAESEGVSFGGMRLALISLGVELRERGTPESSGPKTDPERAAKKTFYPLTHTTAEKLIIALLKRGRPMTADELAAATSLSRQRVFAAMAEIGSRRGSRPLVDTRKAGRHPGAGRAWQVYALTPHGEETAASASKRPVLTAKRAKARYVHGGETVEEIAGDTFNVSVVRNLLINNDVDVT